uniref:TAP binding protein like n=1 Tax=Tetraodon nigroviridis TaxID=99883 RepID=H3CRH5_TETNG
MLTRVILFIFSLKCVCGNVADVVLACSLVEEGVELGGLHGGPSFTRTPATLVLKDVAVAAEESLELLTPFVPPSVPDPDAIILEVKATASSPQIPNVDMLLHADCNDLEVTCEMSQYSVGEAHKRSGVAHFMVSVSVEASRFSMVLILQTLAVEGPSTLVQSRLGLPLGLSGTLSTEVVFLVFSQRNSESAQLKSDAVLHCGFRRQEAPPAQDVGVEWRLQHKGRGWKVLQTQTRLDGTEQNAAVHEERRGSSVNLTQVVAEGDASVFLSNLKVRDEGSYICSVRLGPFHAQQIIRLHLFQPPQVLLSQEKLVWKEEPQTLSCHSAKYYPLDVQMEWLLLPPSDTEPTVSKDQGSLSSHRQHADGSYSLASHLAVPSTVAPGTQIICRVSHRALEAPLSVSLLVEKPQASSYWWIVGFLIITVLFFYQVMK